MAAASPRPREATPPPLIGKAGRYTVFITPPSPTAGNAPLKTPSSPSPSPSAFSRPPITGNAPLKFPPPPAVAAPVAAPPVQVPPLQFEKGKAKAAGSGSVFGFFWNAVAKVQDAHSSLDEYLAEWFGLDQSKYQWALNDYYENNGKEKAEGKSGKKEQISGKGQSV